MSINGKWAEEGYFTNWVKKRRGGRRVSLSLNTDKMLVFKLTLFSQYVYNIKEAKKRKVYIL